MHFLYPFAVFALIATAGFARNPPTSAEELQAVLEAALRSQNTNAVEMLFNNEPGTNEWKEAVEFRETTIKIQARGMLGVKEPIVERVALPADFRLTQIHEMRGLYEKFNVDVVGMLKIHSTRQSNDIQLPYGFKGDVFYVAAPIVEKMPGFRLSVNVYAGPRSDLMTFTGSWVYVRGGEEVKVNISDSTNRFIICWGDYIKSCSIQRTSTNRSESDISWFYYQVNENGSTVFESPEITDKTPVIYERK